MISSRDTGSPIDGHDDKERSPLAATGSGRVLVLQGDLTKLALDDVLIPCDSEGNFHKGFASLVGDDEHEIATFKPADYRRHKSFTERSGDDVVKTTPDSDPSTRGWLVDTSIRPDSSVDSLMSRLQAALETVRQHSPSMRTIGLTPVGISGGGYDGHYSEVLVKQLDLLESFSEDYPINLVLVIRRRADYAAIQHLRRTQYSGHERGMVELGDLASQDKLVLFIGAGASFAAGNPSWQGLIDQLAGDANITAGPLEQLRDLDPRDQIAVITARKQEKGIESSGIRDEIAAATKCTQYSVAQGLLASLRLSQAITTNYDTQYEDAVSGASAETNKSEQVVTIIPDEHCAPAGRWLLKMHGDAEKPSTIVISRDDYLDFDNYRTPAAAMLQARMLTGHLLFVGYSISDENVIRMAREVQRFREKFQETKSTKKVGTVISPGIPAMKQELWKDVLDFVDVGQEANDQSADKVLELLDLVGMYACKETPFFLERKYSAIVDTANGAESDQAASADTEALLTALTELASIAERVHARSTGKPDGSRTVNTSVARAALDLVESLGRPAPTPAAASPNQ
jgi:hypothetical protein